MTAGPQMPEWPKGKYTAEYEIYLIADCWEQRCRLAVGALMDVADLGPCAIRTRRDCENYAKDTLKLILPLPPKASP